MNDPASKDITGMRDVSRDWYGEHVGVIDGVPFHVITWEQPGGFAGQAILGKDKGITRDIFTSHLTRAAAAHIAVYDAYRDAVRVRC